MTKFSPKTCEKIIKAIKAGNTQKTAAAIAGVDESTFYRWADKGKKAKSGKYCEFYKSLKKAEEWCKAYHIDQIRKASEKGSWQASAWYLERRYPNDWGRKQQINAEVKSESKQEVNINIHDAIKEAEDYFETINQQRKGSDMEDNPPK